MGDPPVPAPIIVRGRELHFGERTWIMGIVNITPDSFSGDGLLEREDATAAAIAQAEAMIRDGADLIDIGGESTRPGAGTIGVDEELSRVVEVVEGVRGRLPDVPISIDTTKTEVAAAALAAGADIINDVEAVTGRAALASIAAEHGAPYILMHSRNRAAYADVVAEVAADLEAAVAAAVAAGCDPATLIVDPGIGFGKTAEQNLLLLRDLAALRALGRPILLGTSRKSTIGAVLGLPPSERLEGTLATTALGIAAGVDIIRVHDVAANVRAARMSDAVVRGGWQDAGGPGLIAGVRD